MSRQHPFAFQERVAEHLLAGRNVILQAPTGAGKTRAALLPWMHAIQRGRPAEFPIRCIYSVPMRVLATQFIQQYQEATRAFGMRHGLAYVRAAIQTGEAPNDPLFEQMLLFATLDQTLSSMLGIPYSLSQRQANLNAGAVMSSYLVWDEFHLFGREQALPTTLHLLRMLKGITPFCLMTATFSQTLLAGLAGWLDATVVTVSAQERDAIPSQQGKQRTVCMVEGLLTAQAVLDGFNRRTVAICNTVERAQRLYRDLRHLAPPDVAIELLHSRFYQRDRERVTGWVQQEFAEGWQQREGGARKAILIATQVVEVGMDITCETLHTELAPANTLIQRAGRCARFAGEQGTVFIYALPVNEEGKMQTAPYDMGTEGNLCARSWSAFGAATGGGKVLDYEAELAILQEVHQADDEALLEEIRTSEYEHRRKMTEAMARHEYRHGSALIRDVDSRAVVIHPNPNEDPLLMRSPWAREALAIPRGTFFRLAKGSKGMSPEAPPPWLAYEEEERDWTLCYPFLAEGGEGDERKVGPPRFEWRRVERESDLTTNVLFAIHPSLVTYDPSLGLLLEPNEAATHEAPERDRKGRTKESSYTYELESYEEHISGLWEVCLGGFTRGKASYPPLLDEAAYSLPRLAARCGCSAETLLSVVRVVIAGHDIGKLGKGWQDWVRRWQEKVGRPYDASQCYAHTDYDGSEAHKLLQRSLPPRPPHAAESAVALVNILAEVTDATEANKTLWQAALTALARHHTATHSGELKEGWQGGSLARATLQRTFAALEIDGEWVGQVLWREPKGIGVADDLVAADQLQPEALLAYLWLSRLLRLADQRSQQLYKVRL